MHEFKKILIFSVFIAGACFSTVIYASLYTREGGLVYDDISKITWTSNANLFQYLANSPENNNFIQQVIDANNGIIYGLGKNTFLDKHTLSFSDFNLTTGTLNWYGAQAFIGYLNSMNYAGYNDWRLPTTWPTFGGYSEGGSEFGQLYYTELGGKPAMQLASVHNGNYFLFSGIQGFPYWSSTIYDRDFTYAWYFNLGSGGVQAFTSKSAFQNVWAVRNGDITVIPIHIPAWLFGLILLGLMRFTGLLGQIRSAMV
ncbi:DUF1566 domain-containing protein [Methylomonas sp. LW13]|uniref:Lcl C-terminal domain-containing protein n=1 Tax=unclassified Methylomonas TaxID=2608980 RepID=UPI00051C6591|nr:DUF1566 domain-containing protein [Methylomonas sp. LW13]QBC27961.1 DUF1566 domain-containing protein [Methylomonas sp. LW13]